MHINPVNVTVSCGIFSFSMCSAFTCLFAAIVACLWAWKYYSTPGPMRTMQPFCLSGRFWPVARGPRPFSETSFFFFLYFNVSFSLSLFISLFASGRCDLQCPHSHLSTLFFLLYFFFYSRPSMCTRSRWFCLSSRVIRWCRTDERCFRTNVDTITVYIASITPRQIKNK